MKVGKRDSFNNRITNAENISLMKDRWNYTPLWIMVMAIGIFHNNNKYNIIITNSTETEVRPNKQIFLQEREAV